MQQIVCLKQVPDTSQQLRVDERGRDVVREGMEYVISPYDEFAIEYALRLKEAVGGGAVALLTAGPDRCQKVLRSGLAMGCDSAYHVKDPALEGADPAATARALAAAIRKIGTVDLVWTGRHAVEEDAGQVGQWIAEVLDLPHVAEVKDLVLAPDRRGLVAHHDVEGGEEHVECPLPCVLTATKGRKNEKGESIEPRFASLKGIMRAKGVPIPAWGLSDLGLEPAAVAPRVQLQRLATPVERRAGLRWIEGELVQVVAQAVKVLKDELKVI